MSSMIWITSPTEAWEAVPVLSSDQSSVTVRRKGVEVKIPGTLASFDTTTSQALEEDCENLVDLEAYNEGIILHHNKKRFAVDKIYTLVGNILIALNPYKKLDIYGQHIVDRIYQRVSRMEDPIPHVFTIAATAVHNMRSEKKDQSILISGESGAGKTEATKLILQFISTVCGSTSSRVGVSIENQILDSNPLLESFGNAKTIRNNNSSRFGKYMEVNFDKKYNIRGCNVTAYLLEKSRVVKQGPNERNYHIFYMFLAGASKEMKKEFQLKPADQFHYLMQSNCLEIAHRSDMQEFEELTFAMQNLNLDEAVQHEIYRCLAAILHLGNLRFVIDKEIDGGSKITSSSDCRHIATLLQLDPDLLERSLCNKDAVINGEALLIPLTPEKAVDQRDSLAKFIYSKLFDQIVYRVNSSLFRGKSNNSIGVLDIFGFEVFQVNSFEQLCINYCNERLQTFFNEVIFEGEMKMYALEGLPIDDISYQDNMGCVRLIDLRGAGIFAYLDEEVSVPKGSDEKFVSKINQIFDENANTKSVFFQRNHKAATAFTVRHFAGDVAYDATNFLEKNRDAIAESLMTLIATSKVALLTQVIPALHTSPAAATDANPQASISGKGGKKGSSKLTLCAKFKADLDLLMSTLRATVPHFIRCIKPNVEQVSAKFDPVLVLNQLKYSGLFEAIRIRKAGYEVRIAHDLFVKRYKHCVVHGVPKEITKAIVSSKSSAADLAQAYKDYAEYLVAKILEKLNVDEFWIERKKLLERNALKGQGKKQVAEAVSNATKKREHCVGKSKVFFRSQIMKILFDEYRDACKGNLIAQIQKLVRGFLTRCHMRHLMGERTKRKELERIREREESSVMKLEDDLAREMETLYKKDSGLQYRIQEARRVRIAEEKKRISEQRMKAAILIQARFRGGLYRRRSRVKMCELLLEQALQTHDEVQIERAIAKPKKWRVTSKVIQHYRKNAKKLLLEVMHEGYVENKLQEAVLIQSIPLLKEAMGMAEEREMPYLVTLPVARELYAKLSKNRMILGLLQNELSKCLNMSTLMLKYDVIQYLIEEASERRMLHEDIVINAATRLKRVSNLLTLRQRLRYSVEICSPTKMQRYLLERKKVVKLYGEDFLAAEANAIENMLNMLRYQQTLLTPLDSIKNTTTVAVEEEPEENSTPASNEGVGRRLNMHEIYCYVIHGGGIEYSEDHLGSEDNELIYLPKFVRDPLHKMRHATNQTELQAAIVQFSKVVPNEFHRKFYLRVFKWTVAFATWNLAHDHLDSLKQQIAEGAADKDSIADFSVTSEEEKKGRSPAQSPMHGSTLRGSTAMESAKKTLFSSPSKTNTMTRSVSPTKGSPSKTQLGRDTYFTKTVEIKTNANKAAIGRDILYSQRQAKSKVLVRETVKTGMKLTFRNYAHRTDTLIKESLSDIDKFRNSYAKPSTFG